MSDRAFKPPAPEVVERARRHYERELSPEEAQEALGVPLTPSEVEGNLELIRWFRSRYPTPLERSAYVRRAWRRWVGTRQG